jgi:hypothetical protein
LVVLFYFITVARRSQAMPFLGEPRLPRRRAAAICR